MIALWQVWQLYATVSILSSLSVPEWAAMIGGIGGIGVLSTIVTGGVALRRLRMEQPVTMRTVSAEEAESTVRMQSELIGHLRTDADALRQRVERCDRWRREHMAICPMWRDSRGERGR